MVLRFRGSKVQRVQQAVAVAVERDGLVLAVKRPDEPDEELPGIWGLPATTLRDGESPEDALRRLGREKLGVELRPSRELASGEQQRPSGEGRKDYTLRMTVYDASMAGEPRLPEHSDPSAGTLYDALDWLPAESFRDAAARGSLCCELFLETLTGGNTPDTRAT